MRLSLFSSKQCIIKQLLDSVFVISGIIKVEVSVVIIIIIIIVYNWFPRYIRRRWKAMESAYESFY